MNKATIKDFGKVGFANQIFQLGFLSWVSKICGVRPVYFENESKLRENSVALSTLIFRIDNQFSRDEEYRVISLPKDRNIDILPLVGALRVAVKEYGNLEIDGYTQYHTSQLWHWGILDHIVSTFEINSKWSYTKGQVREYLTKIGHTDRWVGVHIRRGDYVFFEKHGVNFTYTITPEDLVTALNDFLDLNYIRNFRVLIISDDLEWARERLASIRGVEFSDVVHKWCRCETAEDILLTDLAALSSVDDLFCSNSSLSILSAALNRRNGLRTRSSPKGGFVPFDIFDTQVLLSRANSYPYSLT